MHGGFDQPRSKAKRLIRMAPYVQLDNRPTFYSYYDSLSIKLRRDLRRQWTRLAETAQADVEYRTMTSRDEVMATVGWLYTKKLEGMSLKNRPCASFSCDEHGNFLRKVCLDRHEDGWSKK